MQQENKLTAQELRIGNYVFDFDGSVMSVLPKTFRNIEYYGWIYQGIPITEEWLERCEQLTGIGTSLNTEYWTTGSIDIDMNRSGRFDVYMSGVNLTTLDYVHEWQNLFYMLTGTELTFKPIQG